MARGYIQKLLSDFQSKKFEDPWYTYMVRYYICTILNLSSHRYHVDGYQGLVRVCDSCHKTHYSKPNVEMTEVGLKMKTGRRSSLGSSLLEKENSDSLFKPRQSYFWELIKNNREKNDKLRSEFYFEQAPNPDLCISIALMHSDSDRVAEFLLYLAVKLSERLRDVFDSPEVDCLYVVDMMKKLLNKSKMLSSMAESVEGVSRISKIIAVNLSGNFSSR